MKKVADTSIGKGNIRKGDVMRKDYSGTEIYRVLSGTKKNYSVKLNESVMEEINKIVKSEGWKNRSQLIEHLLCMWLFDPGFAKLIADSRDIDINWEEAKKQLSK